MDLRQWHTVDFLPRLQILIEARVLCQDGDAYRFRYPYVYYFLKGQYLGQHLDEIDTRAYIKHCCEHLYVRDHAHTVLFLAHHTTDAFVLRSIEESLQGLLRTLSPIEFSGDTTGVSRLMEDAPKLAYSGGRPEEHREKRDKIRDELESESQDSLCDKEEQNKELSVSAQIASLLKTTEILGQVLKNQYSKITRKRKAELLHQVFAGPLRLLRHFYVALEANPDSLQLSVEAALDRFGQNLDAETKRSVARRLVASLILLVGTALIGNAANSANSDSLLEDVEQVIQENGTVAFQLIGAAIALDSPKQLPRRKLSNLLRAARDEPLALRILQLLVLGRLYMFRTTERDLQWLGSELDLKVDRMHTIVYSPNTAKRRVKK